MAKKLALKSFRLKNFKAIRDSGVVEFTPLTVLIGDNGSGKSSLIEGLQTYQRIVMNGLDYAMQKWRGFEYISNPPSRYSGKKKNVPVTVNSIEFSLRSNLAAKLCRTELTVNRKRDSGQIFIQDERLYLGRRKLLARNVDGSITNDLETRSLELPGDIAVIHSRFSPTLARIFYEDAVAQELAQAMPAFSDWKFLTLNPRGMGDPRALTRSEQTVQLREDGANIAEYLLDIIRRDDQDVSEVFDGIVSTLQVVLPYARDLQPELTSELESAVYLEMTEQEFKVPGWLLSTGTLRILCLLALFRHPEPPPVIIIEELENGLDPRTIHLIVEEIRMLVESGRSQVVFTTHSPYLLDLLPLSSIVLVERINDQPTFRRPVDDETLKGWAEQFTPGDLYTMGNLHS